MADKADLQNWVKDCLREAGGEGSIVEICRYVWNRHETQLRGSGDLFFTWQYDIRWVAHELREKGELRPASESPKGIWQLR